MNPSLSLAALGGLAVALSGFVLTTGALADTVRLQDGDVVEGDVADLGDRLRVTTPRGPISVRWRDVDVVLRDRTARDEFDRRRSALEKDDATGLYELALWSVRAGLHDEARGVLSRVVEIDPEHGAARDALAEEKVDGEWLAGSALLRAKGFVARDGRWMLREEAAILERRASAPQKMTDNEVRVSDLIAKAADGGERAQKFALAALEGLPVDALARPALRALRRGTPAERALGAQLLARWGDVDAVRPLVYSALRDREKGVRAAAVKSLIEIDHEDTVRPIARALWSPTPLIAVHAADALGAIGGGTSVEYLLRRVSSGGGPGGRNHLFVGRQISYIADFDVEIAQAAQIGDPIVGTIREGVVLDTRVIGVREEYTTVERRAFYRGLREATGQKLGDEPTAWSEWWEKEGREATAAK